MIFVETSGKFVPGQLVATLGALATIGKTALLAAYARHLNCDWGDVSKTDWRENDAALVRGERLFSAYHNKDDRKFWIITDAARSATTILLPEEY